MAKVNKEQVEKHIQEFIEYNKTNNEAYKKNCQDIEKKYCVTDIENEMEYYTAIISGKDVIKFEDGSEQEVQWTANIESDWGGEEPITDDIEHNFSDEDDEKNDTIEEFVENRVNEFVSEYSSTFEDYYNNMTSFWAEKNYETDYDEIDMTITGNGYVIETTNWNHESLDDFEINEDED